jgi:hypothetical protein
MPKLWIDTNQARSAKALRDLAQLAKSRGVVCVIHPHVYFERRRQERVLRGAAFSPAVFDSFLDAAGILCPGLPFDRERVIGWADTLAARYPSEQAWMAAKLATLGGELKKGYAVMPSSVPMTMDWIIALEVEIDEDSRVLTADTGEEWRALRDTKRLVNWEGAVQWLQGLAPSVP